MRTYTHHYNVPQSSSLEEVWYDNASKTLWVKWYAIKNIFRVDNVTYEQYTKLKSTDSPGRYLNNLRHTHSVVKEYEELQQSSEKGDYVIYNTFVPNHPHMTFTGSAASNFPTYDEPNSKLHSWVVTFGDKTWEGRAENVDLALEEFYRQANVFGITPDVVSVVRK